MAAFYALVGPLPYRPRLAYKGRMLREPLATAAIPGGGTLTLVRRGSDYMIMVGHLELMSTRARFSEEQLAVLTLERLTAEAPRLLIGGYGMGFTFRAALERLPKKGVVAVAEVVPEILDWARGPLAHLTGDTIDDRRATIAIADVATLIDDARRGAAPKYDAILLDVDNGPDGIARTGNKQLYTRAGIARMRDALRPGGILAIWSVSPDSEFTRRLVDSGLAVEIEKVRSRPNNKGRVHTIWFASVPADGSRARR